MLTAFQVLADLENRAAAQGFSMAQVCRRAKVHQAQVSRWKSKDYEPRLSSINKLDVALQDLIRERGK